MNPKSITAGVLLVAGLVLAGCSRSPSQVAEKFYDDMAAGDVDAAKKHATPATGDLLDRLVESQGAGVLKEFGGRTASAETVNGDSATVSFANEDGSTATVQLTKIDGEWKVDFAQIVDDTVRSQLPRTNPPEAADSDP